MASGFLLSVCFIFLPYQCKKKEVGQYQIFEVQYPNENTLLIDTRTGRTWEYAPDILESEESGIEEQGLELSDTEKRERGRVPQNEYPCHHRD